MSERRLPWRLFFAGSVGTALLLLAGLLLVIVMFGTGSANVVWLRGGFPRSFLARSEHSYPLSKQISVWPLKEITTLPKQLR